MALCTLTLNWNGNPNVYVNPNQVVSVQPSGDGTMIQTTGTNGENPYQIYVIEAPHLVAELLDQAARN